ncbi:similar to Saccharomyces cerevisiae YER024W YAT2 Carnitine acetyltransferase [Maudiozyma saulgeensis]|uniref:Similar to Saccharomyces cerevisiae YER024W YAT2 Carnitine acetyltransferase n=1 Tax=Maudiozyma saulgeensis TaxID=1789683 RepID=A0A1X7R5E1_9SACH|nr:similar to Saccharomyces cerevisiae YER024W YAT2 Carnitine acetyltransferase [Kazachstania saulgeensis]
MAIGTTDEINAETFAYEESLPKLPLPKLNKTLNHLKKSLEPLYYADGYYKHPLDPKTIHDLSQCIENFESSKVAEKLQEKLNYYHLNQSSYLDKLHLDINNNTSATDIQDDILPRNPFLILADDAIKGITQEDRAAVLVHSALRFISALKKNILPPDVVTNHSIKDSSTKIAHLSMFPYKNLFGTTRSPVFQNGEVETFDLQKPYTISDLENDEDDEEDEFSSNESIPENDNNSEQKKVKDCFTRNGITIARYPESRHIVIISKGQYYTIDVLDDENDLLYTSNEFTSFFNYIIKDSEKTYNFRASTALGSLTSHSFKNWKYARKRLQKRYPEELHLIDSALFVLVLDESDESDLINNDPEVINSIVHDYDYKPINKDTNQESSINCKRLFYGTSIIDRKGHQVGSCVSRWYDKLQLVVTKDSKAAVIWDSFTCDGSAVLRFTSETYTESILRLAKDVNAGDPEFSLWPTVKQSSIPNDLIRKDKRTMTLDESQIKNIVFKIDWSFSNILNTHVHLSETKLADLISKHDIIHASVPFGRRSALRLGIQPDSMIQVALQIAHYSLYGKMVFSLEPISTRRFRNSRSSFINVQTQELLELCQLFISNSINGPGKLEKFLNTCDSHSQNIRKAKAGSSYEKHFNALKYLYKFHDHYGIDLDEDDKKIAANLFDNSIIAPFSQPELIVANCGNSATTTFGITPVVPQGFGIGYIIKDDQCDITVTSQFRQGDRLMFMLVWVLHEIRSYWKEARTLDQNRTGVKISPGVDRLYQLDNAIKSKMDGQSSNEHSPSPSSAQLNHLSHNKKSLYGNHHHPNSGFRFFDIDSHIDSRGTSVTPPIVNGNRVLMAQGDPLRGQFDGSSSKLSAKLAALSVNDTNYNSSQSLSALTASEKLNTGSEIPQIQPSHTADSSDFDGESINSQSNRYSIDSDSANSSRPDSKKRNVINSKFEIDFDRADVGRKVSTYE